MNRITQYFLVLLLFAGVSAGCEDFLSPSVDQNKPTDTAIESEEDLESVVYGAYDDLNRVEAYGRDFYVSGDVMSDNAWSNANSGRFVGQDQFDFTVNSAYAEGAWDVFYEAIAGANLAIAADLESSDTVDQIKGQAYAIRAFAHFNLLMAYGQQHVDGGGDLGVPYITDYRTAEEAEGDDYIPERDSYDDVLENVESDLGEAVSLMDSENFDPTEFNYWAARALQTRVYLYTEQFDEVIPIAEEIVEDGDFEITPAEDLVSTWESGEGPESLLELAFTGTDRLGTDNISRIYRDTNYGDVQVTSDLYDQHEDDDVRLDLYSSGDEGYRIVSKYADENGSDNVRIIRYAEVVLNYAEALAEEGDEVEAKEQLDKITSNRNVDNYTTASVENILEERRIELAMEGHRLYDLIRTERDIEAVDDAGQTEDINYGDYRLALPIPENEIRANSNIEQNEGY